MSSGFAVNLELAVPSSAVDKLFFYAEHGQPMRLTIAETMEIARTLSNYKVLCVERELMLTRRTREILDAREAIRHAERLHKLIERIAAYVDERIRAMDQLERHPMGEQYSALHRVNEILGGAP